MMMRLRGGALVLMALCACATGEQDESAAATFGGDDVIRLLPDSVSSSYLSAGPDGQIVYSLVVDGRLNIFVADSNGTNPRHMSRGVWDQNPRWSPDGQWIAFNREVNGWDVIAVSADSGTERVLVSTPAGERLIGWLPDNSGVVYFKFGQRTELWTATLDGRTTRFVDFEGSVYGVVSPDGQLIAYESLEKGQHTLWLHNLTTNTTKQLTTDGYEFFAGPFAWSPDSRRVLFVSQRTGTADVWSIDVSSGESRQLTLDVRDDFAPAYSPDGRYVAFLSTRGGQTDAWVVADTGGEATRVSDDAAIEYAVEWTRDGTSLLVSGDDGRSHAYLASLDGSAPRRMVNEPTMETDVKLSADGSRIVYTSRDGANLDVRTALVSTGVSTLVAGGPTREYAPDISPDGQRVVFVSNRAGNPDLYVAPTGGGDAVRLLDWSSSESSPTWSPDGQWIAFYSSKESDGDVWLVSADGRDARRLTTTGAFPDNGPPIRWSSDSRHVMYTSPAADSGATVHLVEAQTARVQSIVSGQFFAGYFWPGDSLVSVARFDDGMSRLELRRVADGALVRSLSPTAGKSYESFGLPSPDGRHVALSQFTFQNNDYRPVVRSLTDMTSRVLMNLRGNTTSMWWMPDSKGVVFTAATEVPVMYRRRFVAPRQE